MIIEYTEEVKELECLLERERQHNRTTHTRVADNGENIQKFLRQKFLGSLASKNFPRDILNKGYRYSRTRDQSVTDLFNFSCYHNGSTGSARIFSHFVLPPCVLARSSALKIDVS